MQICSEHWSAIRKAVDDRGMGHLGAKNGQEAMAAIVTELEGRAAENDFDPLMGCANSVMTMGLKVCGLSLMVTKEDGSQPCPICEAMKLYRDWWINGPADAMLQEAKEKGLVS